jgi:multimeric flavodoxin WrbA
MKFVILNGSPREEMSVTFHYFKYIRVNFPDHEYVVHHIGRKIKKIERDEDYFETIIADVVSADGIIWLFPVYTSCVTAQLKRFIELIFERNKVSSFSEKYATSISTSGNYFDHHAHDYIHAISEDLGINYFRGYSADITDILEKVERKRLTLFASNFFRNCENKIPTEKIYDPVKFTYPKFKPSTIEDQPKTYNHTIMLLTDVTDKDISLQNMINVFVKLTPNPVTIVNLNDYEIKGGCLGCLKCNAEGICFYGDDHNDIFHKKLVPADVLIFAPTIKDRHISSQFKMFIDRLIFNGHKPVFQGQQQAFLISGPLRKLHTLRENLVTMPEAGRANLAGIVTDEYKDSSEIINLIKSLIDNIFWSLDNDKFIRPKTFLGVGGHKVFRDLIFKYQIVFPSDYDYYKKEGLFDFPKPFMGNMKALIKPMMRNPKSRQKFYAKAIENQIKLLEKEIKTENFDK